MISKSFFPFQQGAEGVAGRQEHRALNQTTWADTSDPRRQPLCHNECEAPGDAFEPAVRIWSPRLPGIQIPTGKFCRMAHHLLVCFVC